MASKPKNGWYLTTRKPWAVQLEARRRSEGHAKYGYFLECGLGKTDTALNDFVGNDDVDLCIVLAPQSFKADWPVAVTNNKLDFKAGFWPQDDLPHDWERGLFSLNYEAISRSSAKYDLQKLMDRRKCMLIIDESKALGNPTSGWTKSTIELAKRSKMARLLNGTPTTQSPMDLYGQLRALGEIQGWTATEFRNRFAVLGGYMGKQVQPEIKNGEELARILDRCSFRALKADWRKDLPPKIYTTVHLEMTNAQRKHYVTMMQDFYVMVSDETSPVIAEMVVTQVGKLRQISSGFIIDGDGNEQTFLKPSDNPKLKATIDLINNNSGKTIVAHFHRVSGRVLIDACQKAGLNPAWIQGSMEANEVVYQKDKFNNDPSCRVIIGQERATALGHTLIGQPGDRCNQTVFFENSYSLYYREQLEDRQHRGDQDEPCTYFDLVTSPVEESVIRSLISKREMAQSLDEIVAAVRSWKNKVERLVA